ncbi:hypothetical protein IM40_11035 (plasmid) [Candidatus Paracaedimonas acanthamoebae]|nr:hypothetical protein IM40_11035 [Candidatus Paracaedimonas acanthamoebae]
MRHLKDKSMLSFDIIPFIAVLKDLDNQLVKIYGKIQTFSEDELLFIHKLAKASMIGASTRIENALLGVSAPFV